jgi:rod shape-determining protein MreD
MNNVVIILLSTLISIIITISTFPMGNFSPDWIYLFIIYWILAAPGLYSLLTIWLIGILADATLGAVLGLNGLVYVIISFIILRSYKSLRYFTILQQSIIVFLLLAIKATIIIWIDSLLNMNSYTYTLYWSCLMSAIFWPVVFYSLRYVRRKYNIS